MPFFSGSMAFQSSISQLSAMTDGASNNMASLDDTAKRRYIEEEQERLNMLKEQRIRELETSVRSGASGSNVSNPFLSNPPSQDSYGGGPARTSANQSVIQTRGIEDLLSLDTGAAASTNPFATAVMGNSYGANSGWNQPQQQTGKERLTKRNSFIWRKVSSYLDQRFEFLKGESMKNFVDHIL